MEKGFGMMRAVFILMFWAVGLAACGVAGDPVAPVGGVEPVVEQGVDLTPEGGSV